VGLHQFIRVGKLAMIGAGAMVPLDIPPFSMAQGDRAKLHGLNLIGLRRRGIAPEAVKDLKKAYHQVFDSSATLKETVARLATEERSAPVQEFLSFIQASQRGICRPQTKEDTPTDE